MRKPFSVVTPSFRSSDWLRLCISSVADQGVEVEHIVQDSCSDDATADWLPLDRRVTAVIEKDQGMYDAVNRGLKKSGGQILSFLNCDEQYLPGTLSKVATFFNTHPEVEMCFGDFVVVGKRGEYQFSRKVVIPTLYHTWICHLPAFTCATFFRASLLRTRGLFFDDRFRYVGDGEWMVRCLQQGVKMRLLGDYTSTFTNTGDNLSNHPKALQEHGALGASAPAWSRTCKPLWILRHRWRRWKRGAYSQAPFHYQIYTRESRAQRVNFEVRDPRNQWKL